jgi:glycosyltransferase involved in cell wall biosynthesis
LPQISVIIPAYNVSSYIVETLESVFAQTFVDYEVVIVNDGSPDTEKLERALEPYLDRIRYFKQENRGAGGARNTGLREARAEFIAFLDADDLWLPDYLEEQVKFVREHGWDLVCADAIVFKGAANDAKTYMESLMGDAPPTGEVTFLNLLSAEQSMITSGVVARSESIFEVGLFDEALRNAQDFDLWLRLARDGARLAYQRKVLLRYRSREGSLSGNAINIHRRELRVYDKIEQSYDLTAAEREQVFPVIENRRSFLEFELGKLLLAEGDFANARDAFARANKSRSSWKTRAALGFSRLAPRLMQSLYVRHLRNAYAK